MVQAHARLQNRHREEGVHAERAPRHRAGGRMKLIDPEKGEGTLVSHLTEDVKTCLIVFWHGVGDAVMFKVLLEKLIRDFPGVDFKVGLAKGLQEEAIFDGN